MAARSSQEPSTASSDDTLPEAVREDYLSSYAGDRFVESMAYVRNYPNDLPILAERLGDIPTPVQIIAGRHDALVPPSRRRVPARSPAQQQARPPGHRPFHLGGRRRPLPASDEGLGQNLTQPGGSSVSTGHATHVIVLPGGGYAEHAANEGEPMVAGCRARCARQRVPLPAVGAPPRAAGRRAGRDSPPARGWLERIGLIGFSAGGHLAGLAALATGAAADEAVDFGVLGYPITSMETETYRPSRLILLGDDATPELRRATSLDALVTSASPPFFVWHTAEDAYVPPEHRYRLAASLAAHDVPHTAHVFAHGPHSLGLAKGARDAATWTTLAALWISEQSDTRPATPPIGTETAWN